MEKDREESCYRKGGVEKAERVTDRLKRNNAKCSLSIFVSSIGTTASTTTQLMIRLRVQKDYSDATPLWFSL